MWRRWTLVIALLVVGGLAWLAFHGSAIMLPVVGPVGQDSATTGLFVWYEEEDFEDCGLAPMAGEAEVQACTDVWQKAAGPFDTLDACTVTEIRYSQKAIEEFRCSDKRPTSCNDDQEGMANSCSYTPPPPRGG